MTIHIVVIPYYLSLRYNSSVPSCMFIKVVIPYYLSLRYNRIQRILHITAVVIPYYLSLRYNTNRQYLVVADGCNSLLSLAKV